MSRKKDRAIIEHYINSPEFKAETKKLCGEPNFTKIDWELNLILIDGPKKSYGAHLSDLIADLKKELLKSLKDVH